MLRNIHLVSYDTEEKFRSLNVAYLPTGMKIAELFYFFESFLLQD